MAERHDAAKVKKTTFSRGQITPSKQPASTNIRQDDEAQQNQRKHIEDYISELRRKLIDDFEKTFQQKLRDDFEKTFLQRSNSSDPTACLEECRITCVAILVFKGDRQDVKEQYELRLTSGEPPIFKKLENVPRTTPSEDQGMTDGPTHTPPETSVHTTNVANKATRLLPA